MEPGIVSIGLERLKVVGIELLVSKLMADKHSTKEAADTPHLVEHMFVQFEQLVTHKFDSNDLGPNKAVAGPSLASNLLEQVGCCKW